MSAEHVQSVADVIDPCVVCGVSTGTAGSYYSDRTSLPGPGGAVTFLCSDCRLAARGKRKPTVDPNEPRGNLQVAIPMHSPWFP
jgi:hypothetical protein